MQNYLEAIEILSKSVDLHEGEIKEFTREILVQSSNTLGCSRCNAWLFEQDQNKLVSLVSYSSFNGCSSNEIALYKSELPNYFKFLKKN